MCSLHILHVFYIYKYPLNKNINHYGIHNININNNFQGDCLVVAGDDELLKIHYHTNEPWDVLKYCRTKGEIFDIVVEDMDRQSRGLKG